MAHFGVGVELEKKCARNGPKMMFEVAVPRVDMALRPAHRDNVAGEPVRTVLAAVRGVPQVAHAVEGGVWVRPGGGWVGDATADALGKDLESLR